MMQSTGPRRSESSVAHVLLDTLIAHGVDTLFGVPGSAISAVFDACADRAVTLTFSRHETSAVFEAMGHYRATGRPAVVLVGVAWRVD